MLLKKILFKFKDYLYLNILITNLYDLFICIINSENLKSFKYFHPVKD